MVISRFAFILILCCTSVTAGLSQGVDTLPFFREEREVPAVAKPDTVIPVSTPRVVTIMLPLHLDSIFSGYQFRKGSGLPRYVLPQLEFFHGVEMAVDELNRQQVKATVQVVDTRRAASLPELFNDYDIRRSNMLIAVAKDAAELKQMAAFAQKQGIPLVSATYPSDAGIQSNGKLAILNTTLRTHVEGLSSYLKRQHAGAVPVVLTRRGSAEASLNTWLAQSYGRKLTTATLQDSVLARQIVPYLDSNKTNVLVITSLNEGFVTRALKQLSELAPAYDMVIAGMPTWDEMDFRKREFKGLRLVYGTPFAAFTSNVDLYKNFSAAFEEKVGSRPSDMAFKGYDITYRMVKHFAGMTAMDSVFATNYPADPYSFSRWEFKPIHAGSGNILFYENQKLYFVLKEDGLVKGVY